MFGPEVGNKRRTIWGYWCKVCESFLLGNGSVVTPYKCQCGVYEYSFDLKRYKHPKEGK